MTPREHRQAFLLLLLILIRGIDVKQITIKQNKIRKSEAGPRIRGRWSEKTSLSRREGLREGAGQQISL